ncbi:CheR family methyltransferase [Pararobbsia alpina]|uniref:protein-glutamate O-methyltransferase n=1 Tax=Pararobbsia alpina TaxID=621374 RepID=A0A6S7AZJ6_9BURK|nr:protein-glutamate O-methyltransferase CheR [Pararobbsia alpina]CAB3783128.1 Chemotaxis protein methyltransferase Cher2 [Pararobbsia alpina]
MEIDTALAQGDGDLSGPELRKLLAMVREHTGIAMSERKRSLLQGRLRRRMRALSLTSYADYLCRVESQPAEVTHFIDLVTTNETSFFRTPRVWAYFAEHFLPEWQRAHPRETLEVWSAASSSGEEAYSIAMLADAMRLSQPPFDYRVFGTDICSSVVETARMGRYEGRSMDSLRTSRPDVAARYFSAEGEAWRAAPELRARVQFERHNLMRPLSSLRLASRARRFDIVFLRNVLIYFDGPSQQQIVSNICAAMKPGALLVLGESESLQRFDTGLRFEQPLFYRKVTGDAHV